MLEVRSRRSIALYWGEANMAVTFSGTAGFRFRVASVFTEYY